MAKQEDDSIEISAELINSIEALVDDRIALARKDRPALRLIPEWILRAVYLFGFQDGIECTLKVTNNLIARASAMREAAELMNSNDDDAIH